MSRFVRVAIATIGDAIPFAIGYFTARHFGLLAAWLFGFVAIAGVRIELLLILRWMLRGRQRQRPRGVRNG